MTKEQLQVMLEQFLKNILNLSKAKDAEYSVGSTSYWRKYLATNSQYIYGGSEPAGITTTGYSIPSNNTFRC